MIFSGLGIVLLVVWVKNRGRSPSKRGRRIADVEQWLSVPPDHLVVGFRSAEMRSRVVMACLAEPARLEWLDDPTQLADEIGECVPAHVLEALGLTSETAAAAIRAELRAVIPGRLSRRLESLLPPELQRAASEAIAQVELGDGSLEEFVSRVRTSLRGALPTFGRQNATLARAPIDFSVLLVSLGLLLVGVATALVAGGGWRSLLGF